MTRTPPDERGAGEPPKRMPLRSMLAIFHATECDEMPYRDDVDAVTAWLEAKRVGWHDPAEFLDALRIPEPGEPAPSDERTLDEAVREALYMVSDDGTGDAVYRVEKAGAALAESRAEVERLQSVNEEWASRASEQNVEALRDENAALRERVRVLTEALGDCVRECSMACTRTTGGCYKSMPCPACDAADAGRRALASGKPESEER